MPEVGESDDDGVMVAQNVLRHSGCIPYKFEPKVMFAAIRLGYMLKSRDDITPALIAALQIRATG